MTASRPVVLDASVAVKWVCPEPAREPHAGVARLILRQVQSGALRLLQPVHFLPEVAAVVVRESPRTANQDVLDLMQIEFDVVDHPEVLLRAVALAREHRQHVFDTLYHAVALDSEEAVLVTADDRYWRAARDAGRIVRLSDYATLH